MAARSKRRSWLIAAIAVALLVALVIGGRGAWRLYSRFDGRPPPPRQTDVSAIAGWMPIRLVSRSYRVPESELYGALGVEPQRGRPPTLDEIAAESGRGSDEVVATVQDTVRQWQASHPDQATPGAPDRAGPTSRPVPPGRPGP